MTTRQRKPSVTGSRKSLFFGCGMLRAGAVCWLVLACCADLPHHSQRGALAGEQELAGRYAGLDSAKYLGEVKIEAKVSGEKFFTEGPAVDAGGNVFFTNIPNLAGAQVLKWDPAKRELSIYRERSNAANGLLFDAQGRLWACEGGADDKGRVTRTDMKAGEISVMADSYNGKPLGAPNDLTTDRKGRIYFSSRLANGDPGAGNVNSVYRIDLDGSLHRVLATPAIDMPNGLDTSPDGKTFYLVESDGREGRARRIRAYDLQDDGTVRNERLLYDFYPGRSGDGLCLDQEGNLYVAAGLHKTRGTSETLATRPGIHVISPQGKLLAYVETPEDTITNCAFGGEDRRTLYITCGRYLLSCRTQVPGFRVP